MSKSIHGWTIVRELPGEQNSEESYIRNETIRRVSIVENDDRTISVLVHVLDATYLAAVSDNLHEAQRQLESIVQSINEKQMQPNSTVDMARTLFHFGRHSDLTEGVIDGNARAANGEPLRS